MFFKTVFNSVKDQNIFKPNLVRLYSNLSSVNIRPHLYNHNVKCTQTYLNLRKIHCCHSLHRIYIERENNYLYNCINYSLLEDFKWKIDSDIIVTNYDQFETVLNQNWRASNATEILKAFKSVKQFCIEKAIPISESRFDNLVDGLMDHCEKLTDDQILELLYCLAEYPLCESYASHNFHDVWSCLDDICCWKMHDWDMDKVLNFAGAFFKLNLARFSDYTYEVVNRHTKKASSLSKDQLVKMFFIINASRRTKVDFEYEYALQSKISEMNIDEMAVVASGYFKTECTIHLVPIIEEMINRVMENSKTIHDIALSAILKILRLSKPVKIPQKICQMLDKLTPEIDRLSDLACLHLALAPTGLLVLHEKSLKKCAEKLGKKFDDVNKIRIKEIDRLLNVLTMFNFDPKITPDIFEIAYKELHRPERDLEVEKYPKSFVSCLNYFSMKGIYSYELTNRVLDMDYVKKNYGKMASKVPRELFSLDCCIDIECPDYKGKRLPPDIRYKATKWHSEFVPSYDQYRKLTAAEKFMLDVMDTVKRIVKNDSFLYVSHVLPHFPRADIIICKNKTTNEFIEPAGFQKYVFGDIKVPKSDENLQWFALMLLGWNNTIRDTSTPLGHMVMKERQLRKIGYKPVMDFYGDQAHETGGTTISSDGVITMRLRDRIRVDISSEKAVRIVNAKNNIVLALSSSGASSGMIHPNGRVFQYGSRVEIIANDAQGNHKSAKMWYKGVSFSSISSALVYLVDSAGTRTTTDNFNDLSNMDFTMNIFYEDSPYMDTPPTTSEATKLVNKAVQTLEETNYWVAEDGTNNWIINSVRISQTSDGLVRVGRNSNKFSLRTSPTNGSASISSPYVHCTGSMGQTRHLFVRRGERRMHYDGQTFIVRNAGHSAGFDEKHQLKVY